MVFIVLSVCVSSVELPAPSGRRRGPAVSSGQSSPSSMIVTTGAASSPGPHNDHSLTSSRRELETSFPDEANRFRLHQVHQNAVFNRLSTRINGDGFAVDVPKVSTARVHGVGLSTLSEISPAAIGMTATRLPGANPSLANHWPCNLIFGCVLRRKKSPAISIFIFREFMCYPFVGKVFFIVTKTIPKLL